VEQFPIRNKAQVWSVASIGREGVVWGCPG